MCSANLFFTRTLAFTFFAAILDARLRRFSNLKQIPLSFSLQKMSKSKEPFLQKKFRERTPPCVPCFLNSLMLKWCCKNEGWRTNTLLRIDYPLHRRRRCCVLFKHTRNDFWGGEKRLPIFSSFFREWRASLSVLCRHPPQILFRLILLGERRIGRKENGSRRAPKNAAFQFPSLMLLRRRVGLPCAVAAGVNKIKRVWFKFGFRTIFDGFMFWKIKSKPKLFSAAF